MICVLARFRSLYFVVLRNHVNITYMPKLYSQCVYHDTSSTIYLVYTVQNIMMTDQCRTLKSQTLPVRSSSTSSNTVTILTVRNSSHLSERHIGNNFVLLSQRFYVHATRVCLEPTRHYCKEEKQRPDQVVDYKPHCCICNKNEEREERKGQ